MGYIVVGRDAALHKAVPKIGLRKFTCKSAAQLAGYAKDKKGAIAVETALVTPFILFGMLIGASLAFSIFNHQKVYTAAYSGASYLHDKVATGDYSGLKGMPDQNGNQQEGEWITTAKLVIKDASGLPLDLNKINVDTFCACPAVSPGVFASDEETDELANRTTFYDRTAFVETGGNDVCPATCLDGNQSRIIAEILIDYQATSLKGGTDPIREKLVTRLR